MAGLQCIDRVTKGLPSRRQGWGTLQLNIRKNPEMRDRNIPDMLACHDSIPGVAHAVSPPSMATIEPVAKVAASLARNSTGPASSSVLAMRRCALSLAMIR